jgi:diacylglycerol kinase
MTNHKMVKAFGYAFNGWKRGFEENNIKIHLWATFLVLLASIVFEISIAEFLIIILLIGLVISAELFNTAIEEICNVIKFKLKLDYSDTTMARDLAAGAVLVVSVVALLIGSIIFVPKVLTLFL